MILWGSPETTCDICGYNMIGFLSCSCRVFECLSRGQRNYPWIWERYPIFRWVQERFLFFLFVVHWEMWKTRWRMLSKLEDFFFYQAFVPFYGRFCFYELSDATTALNIHSVCRKPWQILTWWRCSKWENVKAMVGTEPETYISWPGYLFRLPSVKVCDKYTAQLYLPLKASVYKQNLSIKGERELKFLKSSRKNRRKEASASGGGTITFKVETVGTCWISCWSIVETHWAGLRQ